MASSVTCDMLPGLYNQYLIDLLLIVKSTPAVRKAISTAGHKAISTDTKAHIDTAVASMFRVTTGKDDEESTCRACLAHTSIQDATPEAEFAKSFEPLSSITFKQLLEVKQDDRDMVALYVYTLATLAAVYNDKDDDLAANVSKILTRAQSDRDDSDVLQAMDGILEEDIVELLEKVSSLTHTSKNDASNADDNGDEGAEGAGGAGMDELLEKMKDSKIAGIAEEISKDIDVSALGDIASGGGLNFSDLTNANSPLGSIVGKVGATIQKKMASGELNQADLMKEALSFLGAAGGMGGGMGGGGGAGMGGMSDLFSMMSGLGAGGAGGAGGGAGGGDDIAKMAQRAASTPVGRRAAMQSRLRRKLAQNNPPTPPSN